MQIDNVEEWIVRQLAGKLTDAETSELRAWYDASEANRKLYRDCCVLLKADAIGAGKQLFEQRQAASWNRLHRRMRQERMQRFWMPMAKYAAVAAVALLLGVGGHAWLAGGTDKGGQVVVEVPAGSKSRVLLPDGSTVWLNSATRLAYAKDFGKTNRKLYLDGEGFFDVTKNRQLPFEVHAGEARIRVLGTRFNMKAYSEDEKQRITLLEGSLSIGLNERQGQETLIVPNEQAVIENGTAEISVHRVEADEYAGWTKPRTEKLEAEPVAADRQLPQMQVPNSTVRNTLLFDEERLSQIVRDLERAFNVHIEIEDEAIAETVYYGDFRNEESIYQILDAIASSGEIGYRVEDNKIIINKYHHQNELPMGK